MSITHEDWLAELERLSALTGRNDEGLTLLEWAAKLSMSRDRVRAALGAAKKRGWLITGQRQGETLDGRHFLAPVYRIVKPVDAKGHNGGKMPTKGGKA